jgi:hypothetical protein
VFGLMILPNHEQISLIFIGDFWDCHIQDHLKVSG